MDPKFKAGSIFLPLLLVLAISGFFLVKAVVFRTFTDAQVNASASVEGRFDPYSAKYSLSKQMGRLDTWQTYTNDDFNYQLKHPQTWLDTLRTFPATRDFYEASLADNVILSVAIQEIFPEPKDGEKIKSKSGEKFYFYQDDPDAKGAYTEENGLFYIIRLKEDNYFGSEQEFKATFFLIVKNFEFLD